MTSDRATARAQIEELYAAYHQEIYSYLSRMLRNEELAADLTQETFVKAFRAFDTLTDQSRSRAWLYQIALNVFRNRVARRSLSVVPTKTVALFSGLVKIGAGGIANVPLDVPDEDWLPAA